jgi:hypothetical protein
VTETGGGGLGELQSGWREPLSWALPLCEASRRSITHQPPFQARLNRSAIVSDSIVEELGFPNSAEKVDLR